MLSSNSLSPDQKKSQNFQNQGNLQDNQNLGNPQKIENFALETSPSHEISLKHQISQKYAKHHKISLYNTIRHQVNLVDDSGENFTSSLAHTQKSDYCKQKGLTQIVTNIKKQGSQEGEEGNSGNLRSLKTWKRSPWSSNKLRRGRQSKNIHQRNSIQTSQSSGKQVRNIFSKKVVSDYPKCRMTESRAWPSQKATEAWRERSQPGSSAQATLEASLEKTS